MGYKFIHLYKNAAAAAAAAAAADDDDDDVDDAVAMVTACSIVMA